MNVPKELRAEMLAELYNNSKPLGMGFLHYTSELMDVEEAKKLLKESTYFDYLKGRVMKIDFIEEEIETWLYNRDNGDGAAERCLETVLARYK